MFPPFWGSPMTSTMLQQVQHELEQMRNRFDAVFRVMLNPDHRIVAQTPADVVYSEGKLRLLRYRPVVAQPYPVPLLMVPSLFSRYYILDLVPGNSLVEYLVGQGIDVYLLDWGEPGPEDRYITLDEYITGSLRRAVQRVRSLAQRERISLLGYSMGGTITAVWSALNNQYVENLVQLAAPINFHDHSLLSQWTRKERFNVDLIVDTLGTMPFALMQASFRMLTPVVQIMQQVTLADKSGDMDAVRDLLALQQWMNDTTPFLGEAYRTYIKDCYQENYLVQGKLVVNRQRVDLARIECALLTVAATKDYFCPPQSVAVLNDLVSSADKQVLEVPSGHVGLIVGRTASELLWPKLAGWLRDRSIDPLPGQHLPPAPAGAPGSETAPANGGAPEEPAAVAAPPKPARRPARRRQASPAPAAGDAAGRAGESSAQEPIQPQAPEPEGGA